MRWIMILMLIVGCGIVGMDSKAGMYNYTKREISGERLREIPIWVDIEFGEGDRVEIVRAIERWNYAMNGYVILGVVDWKFNMEVRKIEESQRRIGWIVMKIKRGNSIIPGKALGFANCVGCDHIYIVRDAIENGDIYGIMLHEIGHLMGSGHIGDRLMHRYFNRERYRCIDEETIGEVSKYFGINRNRLNYCIDGIRKVEYTDEEICLVGED